MQFYMPTKLYYGNDIISQHKEEMILGEKAIIVTGRNSAKITGALDDVLSVLKDFNVPYIHYDEIGENPTYEMVLKGKELAIKNECDFVIAIGGGSPMDAGKAIAVLAANPDLSPDNLFDMNNYDVALPIVTIPTTAGTGSEVTEYAVLTKPNGRKSGFKSDLIFPDVSYLDSKYMVKMNKSLTITTAVDALSHAVEGILSKKSTTISNILAREAITLIYNYLPQTLENPENIEFREKLAIASTLAGMVIAQTGTILPHAMGYRITIHKKIRHGQATALFLPLIADEVKRFNPEKTKIIEKIFGSLEEFEKFLKKIGVYDLKIEFSEEELELYSDEIMSSSHIKNTPGEYNKDKIKEMYKKITKI
ncbi:alcohol dehydrogenase [Marinitoga hydrogenitolerans DSM 16785]|uniref:Alcohol dehydrogenase n=1 Tax=Marinitoga hydrogenitolerans (strain DSM 16785 / JCM 12826 / AT1271) TaxID=1122195 RepID=A0A1M4SWS1_MARH1|nr:iron-containing alcohol dehydrogenase family protein [Marinitoga hydrogenitolerans]SHE36645.1 alcohol dehydrogenase [Marinitoga hydrogenitolerans DSM 16785]